MESTLSPAGRHVSVFGGHVRFLVLGLVAAAAASAYLTRYCISAANTVMQAELHLDDELMGWVFSVFNLGYFLGQVPSGWLGQRFGTRGVFSLSSIGWSLLTVAVVFATSFSSLAACRFVFGLMQAGLAPLAGQVIKEWIPERRRGIASSLIAASMSVGGGTTLLLTGVLLEQYHIGWRTIFGLYSLVGIVWGAVYYWLARSRPEEHPWMTASELRLIRGEVLQPPGVEAGPIANRTDETSADEVSTSALARRMLASRSLWALCVQSFFRAAGYEFFATWMFAFLEYSHGVKKDEAGWLTNYPLIGYVVGALSGGLVVDFVRRHTVGRWWSRSGTAALALGAAGLLIAASAWSSIPQQLAAIMALGAFASGIASPAIWATTLDIGGRQTGVTVGVMNMAGCLAGVVIPPALGSFIGDLREGGGNWNLVIYIHVGFTLAAAAACLLMNPDECLTDRKPGTKNSDLGEPGGASAK